MSSICSRQWITVDPVTIIMLAGRRVLLNATLIAKYWRYCVLCGATVKQAVSLGLCPITSITWFLLFCGLPPTGLRKISLLWISSANAMFSHQRWPPTVSRYGCSALRVGPWSRLISTDNPLHPLHSHSVRCQITSFKRVWGWLRLTIHRLATVGMPAAV